MNGSIATVNPYRYRGYYYDKETELYYLQSRYYDAEVGRFINGDDAIISCLPIGILNHNMFAYCMNTPVNSDDHTGHSPEVIIAAGKLIATCVALMAVISWMSSAEFKKSWEQFCNTVGNGLSWISTTIKNGAQAAKKWTLKLILAATTAVSAYINFAKADANIRKKVKKNSKQRYWSASVFNTMGYKYVVIYSPISFNTAKSLARTGQSIFAVTKYDAKTLAQRFSGVSGPEKGKQSKCCNQYYHYHIMNKVFKNQHIFYLF